MAILDTLFPGWALRRARARQQLHIVRAQYEAARPTRTHPHKGSTVGPDSLMAAAGLSLRSQARFLDENHDLAIGIFNDIENRVVGTGLTMEQMSITTDSQPAIEWNRQVNQLWREWWRRPETTGEMPGGDVERLVCRSLVRDGEILVHHINSTRFPYLSSVPYVIELLEADFLPYELSSSDPYIVQGVEKNQYGRPLSYRVWKQHPQERGLSGSSILAATSETKRVFATNMSHLKHVKRLRSTRGLPIIHGVIRRLQDLYEYEESERIAARMNADWGAVVRNDPGHFTGKQRSDGAEVWNEFRLDSGMIITQVEGQSVEMVDATRPNSGLEAFRKGQLRAVATGTGTRYSSIAKDYDGTYSSQRQELVEGGIDYAKLREYMVGVWYYPMRRRFIDTAILAGVLRPPADLLPESLYWCEFRGPPVPQIDIQKEMNARIAAVEARLTSRQQAQRDLGNDPEMTDAQIAREDTESPQTTEPSGRGPRWGSQR